MTEEEERQLKILVEAFDFHKAKRNAQLMIEFRQALVELLSTRGRLHPSAEMTQEIGQKYDMLCVECTQISDSVAPILGNLMYITGLMVVILTSNEGLFDKNLGKKITELHGSHGLAMSALLNHSNAETIGQEISYHLRNYLDPFKSFYGKIYEKEVLNPRRKKFHGKKK
jgi:hypothetical protein